MANEYSHPAHKLITREAVEVALRNEKGEKAVITSFKVKDFTAKGDGYACFVTSVEVLFTIDEQSEMTSYVTKINPCQKEAMNGAMAEIFPREASVYTELLPEMNSLLENNDQPHLRIPKCFYSSVEERKEIIFLEDMREKDFKMNKNEDGHDEAHTFLVLGELARLHSVSVLLAAHHQEEELLKKYHCLKSLYSSENYPAVHQSFSDFFRSCTETGSEIAKMMEGYERIASFLDSISSNAMGFIEDEFRKTTAKFKVACHGDCWSNNILFRYDDAGKPVEVCLLDLQCTTNSSISIDLNYYMFTGLAAKMRNDNLQIFLKHYYEGFETVLKASNMSMKFTIEELEKEYRAHNLFGLLFTAIGVPMVMMKDTEALDLHDTSEETNAQKMKNHHENVMKKVKSHPQLKLRMLDTFDEILENGLL